MVVCDCTKQFSPSISHKVSENRRRRTLPPPIGRKHHFSTRPTRVPQPTSHARAQISRKVFHSFSIPPLDRMLDNTYRRRQPLYIVRRRQRRRTIMKIRGSSDRRNEFFSSFLRIYTSTSNAN